MERDLRRTEIWEFLKNLLRRSIVSIKDLTAQRRNNVSISFGSSTRFWELVGIAAVSRQMQCEIAIKIVTEKIKIMNAELRKRLEEATDVFCGCNACPATIIGGKCEKKCTMHEFFKKGFEHGYKEAIAQACEWIFGYVRSNDMLKVSAYDMAEDCRKAMGDDLPTTANHSTLTWQDVREIVEIADYLAEHDYRNKDTMTEAYYTEILTKFNATKQ